MSFDRLAPHYRWMERLLAGGKLQRCRTAFLPQIAEAKNILLLGEGHGRGLLECRRRFPKAQITCVDASAVMLAEAQRNLAKHSMSLEGIEFVHADILNWTPIPETYDLIIANFFLDCFRPDQLEIIIQNIAVSAAPNAHWLVADFQVAASGLKALRSRLILALMYAFFRVATRLPARKITAPDPVLKRNGFKLLERMEADWGLLHADWWQQETGPNPFRARPQEVASRRQIPATNLAANS